MDNHSDNFFMVSVKGLHLNDAGELMMIREGDTWDLPGGRIQKGEQFIDCLKRETFEETGIECEVLEDQPTIVYPTIDLEGRPRVMVFFKIIMQHFNLIPSAEASEIKFFKKEDISNLKLFPQTKSLVDYL